jgi:hypothetical protein
MASADTLATLCPDAGHYNMKMHVLVRFGRWQEIIDEPLLDDPQLMLAPTAMQHYARGVAHASMKDIGQAEREQTLFHESLGRIPPGRRFLSNPVLAMLAVGEKMLDAELEYHRGRRFLRRLCGLYDFYVTDRIMALLKISSS